MLKREGRKWIQERRNKKVRNPLRWTDGATRRGRGGGQIAGGAIA